jgi:hypothetical protein
LDCFGYAILESRAAGLSGPEVLFGGTKPIQIQVLGIRVYERGIASDSYNGQPIVEQHVPVRHWELGV